MRTTDSNLGLFDRINVARCAMERAHNNSLDRNRFVDEYTTAKMWTRYKCYISTIVSFVEPD
jgi:hypothetical protein